jgi:hypothetical protein
VKSNGFVPPGPPGTNRGRSSAIPRQARRAWVPRTARFTKPPLERIEEAPHAPRVGAGAAPPPKPTTPTSQRLTPPSKHTLGQVGEQYGPSIAPFARARCPFYTTLKAIFFRRGSARVARGPVFVFRTPQLFHSIRVLDIPNGVWPLNRAVGRACIRKTVPNSSAYLWRRRPHTKGTWYLIPGADLAKQPNQPTLDQTNLLNARSGA